MTQYRKSLNRKTHSHKKKLSKPPKKNTIINIRSKRHRSIRIKRRRSIRSKRRRSIRIKRRSINIKKRFIIGKKRSINKKSDGMFSDSIGHDLDEKKAQKIINYMKSIDAFKLELEFIELLKKFITTKNPTNLLNIIRSEEYKHYTKEKQQLFFIVFTQQLIIRDNFDFNINLFFSSAYPSTPIKSPSTKLSTSTKSPSTPIKSSPIKLSPLTPIKLSQSTPIKSSHTTPSKISKKLSEDEKENISYIFEFYELLIEMAKTPGALKKKEKIKTIIENLFFVYDYEEKKKELEKKESEEKEEVRKILIKSGGVKNKDAFSKLEIIKQQIKMNETLISKIDIIIDIFKLFDEDEQKLYLSLYKRVIGCIGVHITLTTKRKLIEEIIDIHSLRTNNDDRVNIFFLIFFTKCSGFKFGERIEMVLPMSLITDTSDFNNYYKFFHHTGNKLREETKPYNGMSLKKINYIMDLFYNKDDKDDKKICAYDHIIISENPNKIVKFLFEVDKRDKRENPERILNILFEFLLIKYYIYFNTETIYNNSDYLCGKDGKSGIYNKNMNQIMSLLDSLFDHISNKESRTMLYVDISRFFKNVIEFHGYQKNIYKCIFNDDSKINLIFTDISNRSEEIYNKYIKENEKEIGGENDEKLAEYIGDLKLKKEPVMKEPDVKKIAKKQDDRIKKAEEAERIKAEQDREKERLMERMERKERKERNERLRLENEEEKKRNDKEEQERQRNKEEEMKRKKIEEEEMKSEKIITDKVRREESITAIYEYEIKLDCLDKIKMIDNYERATYVIFGELFYEYIAFLTKLLEEKELFYIIVMGGSSIEKQCSEYKTNDVDIKFIPYDINTLVKVNDPNHKFVVNLIEIFVEKLDSLLTENLSLVYEKVKDKFQDNVDDRLKIYKEALLNLKKQYTFNAFKGDVTSNFESMYEKILIRFFKRDNKNSRKLEFDDKRVVMDVSIYKSNNIYKKLIKKIKGHELMYKDNVRVPKFYKNEDGLNLVDIDYLIYEKTLLANSEYPEEQKKNLESNFIDVENINYPDDKEKTMKKRMERFKHVKQKSEKQIVVLQKCKERLEKKS